ncbi:MAG: hypothetical protein Sapg2KO_27190 [Saprospiraceae bacterium]
MKTQRFLLLLSICYVWSSTAFATPNQLQAFPNSTVVIRLEQKEIGHINLQLANLQRLSTKIQLLDLDGKLWFSKTVKGVNGYAKQYDLNTLPAGTYFFSVEHEKLNHQQLFQKLEKSKALVFFQETVPNTQKMLAQFAKQTNKQDNSSLESVQMTAFGKQKVKLEVKSSTLSNSRIQLRSLGGTKIIEIKAPVEDAYAKVFNLEGLTPGDYYFLIESDATKVIQFMSFSKRHGIQINTQQQLNN